MEKIIQTSDGLKIKITEEPRWNSYFSRYYAAGYRWIKTKEKFSSSHLLHNFTGFEEVA